jgi:gamma-glutamylcyclotransferase (GGCT)/AIG2-like uncharacterized protein YtfP
MLYFAYGSNMSCGAMAGRCPGAQALGTATLERWRFLICPAGYASVEPRAGAVVHGVLWRLGARELAILDAYESLDSGLYVRRRLPVRRDGHLLPAWVYIAGRRGEGRAKPAYFQGVLAAAGEWGLPKAHLDQLRRWSATGWRGAPHKETGEVG